MTGWLVASLLGLLLVAALVQAVPVLRFAAAIGGVTRGKKPEWVSENGWRGSVAEEGLPAASCDSTTADWPQAVCVLCLRGCDPFLKACLQGLLRQEYPHYDVIIIVDHPEDPAWPVIREVLAEHGLQSDPAVGRWMRSLRPVGPARVQVDIRRQLPEESSLKCACLAQVAEQLREEPYEVVALLDADTLPHASWLRELVAPLRQAEIGVASGNRWYMPEEPTWGSLVRYVWNAGAVVQMFWNHFTWGGSVALKREVFCDPRLIDRWRRSLSSDTVIFDVVCRRKLKTAFVPRLLMVNRESCTLRQFFPWVVRQLVVGRLYHPGWPVVLGHGLGSAAVVLAALAVMIVAAVRGQTGAATALLAGLLGYWAAAGLILSALERAVAGVVRLRGEAADWLRGKVWWRFWLAIPLTQLIYPLALLKAIWVRRVGWRGVVYRIEGRTVHLEEYQPYRPVSLPGGQHSL